MGKTLRSKWGLLATAVALTVGLATIPAIGSHFPNDSGTLRLHLGTDATEFVYTPATGPVETQTIEEPTRCVIDETGPLAAVSDSDRGVGLVSYGIGVKSGGAQGTPCSRVDATEDLSIGLVGVPLAASADFDLELKGDAKITIEVWLNGSLLEDFEVRSGGSIVGGQGVDGSPGEPYTAMATTDDAATGVDESVANCRNQSDSGPDAGARDNCRVTIDPSVPFDTVRFVPVAGEMSLEGSSDFGDDPATDTIFYLTSYEGLLDCGDTITDISQSEDVTSRITRYENSDGSDCVSKPYSLLAVDSDPDEDDNPTVTFEIEDPAGQAAIYEAVLRFPDELTTPLSGVLLYDSAPPYDVFKEMLACEEDPYDTSDDPTGSLNDEAIPAGHEGCIVTVKQTWNGYTRWTAIFEGDWRFK